MRKRILYVLGMVAIVAIASVNVLNLRADLGVSDLHLANIAALSDENGGGGGESSEWGCGGNSTFIPNETLRDTKCQIWGLNGTKLSCTLQSKVCCDPSKQTTCQPIKM